MDKEEKAPKGNFPYKKMPRQMKDQEEEHLKDYSLESNEELDLGESERRKRKHTLDDERDAGREP